MTEYVTFGKENMRGNNLKIDINKDFLKEYKSNLYKGFSGSELMYLIGGLSISAVMVVLAMKVFNMQPVFAVYISVPLAAPVMWSGIYRFQDYLKPQDYLREKQYTQDSDRLHYETDEADVTKYFTMHHEEKRQPVSILNIIRKKVA